MNRIIYFFLVFALLFNLSVLPIRAIEETTKSAKPNSYEMFWPLVAGKVLGEPFYTLKLYKENFRGFFIFSDIKKAEYNIMLSDKRILEAEKLFLEKEDRFNGRKTIKSAEQFRDKAIEQYKKAKNSNKNTIELKKIIENSLKRQKIILTYISANDDKIYFKEVLSKLDSSFASL